MAYGTFKKRGKMSAMNKVRDKGYEKDVTPTNMYSAVDLGGAHPDASRRITNNYGKTTGKRAEYRPEVGAESRMTARMFNSIKDGISRYRGF